MNLTDATAIYIGDKAASAVYITNATGAATKVWPPAPTGPTLVDSGTFTATYGWIDEDGTITRTWTATTAGSYRVEATMTGDAGVGLFVRTPAGDTYAERSATVTATLGIGQTIGLGGYAWNNNRTVTVIWSIYRL